jgi:hypothetical protein
MERNTDPERITDEQIRDAKNLATSDEYTRLITLRDEQTTRDLVLAASGCLLRKQGLTLAGLDSKTPTGCPAEGCSARVDKASSSIQNQKTCVDPLSKPERKL